MRKLRTLVFGAMAGALAFTTQAKAEWPEKPIQFIIPFGGGADVEGRMIAKAMSEVLGQPVLPHDLRRTYAQLAYKAGADLRQVQLSLGHSSIRTTEIYLGLDQDFANAPGDLLDISL